MLSVWLVGPDPAEKFRLPDIFRVALTITRRDTYRGEKNDGHFDFKQVRLCVHVVISYSIYKSCTVATPEQPRMLPTRKLGSYSRVRV
jgi:hypothetical protein